MIMMMLGGPAVALGPFVCLSGVSDAEQCVIMDCTWSICICLSGVVVCLMNVLLVCRQNKAVMLLLMLI